MTQAEVANAVGIQQAMLSYIEQGTTHSSRAVIPLCQLLGIKMPRAYEGDELEQRWNEAGRVLRAQDEKMFLTLLTAAELAGRNHGH